MRKHDWKKHTEARVEGRPGYPLVEIIWNDALASAVTEWAEEAGEVVMPTTSVGYLVSKDRGSYTISSLINLSHVGHCLTIPRGCVVGKIRYLAVKALEDSKIST